MNDINIDVIKDALNNYVLSVDDEYYQERKEILEQLKEQPEKSIHELLTGSYSEILKNTRFSTNNKFAVKFLTDVIFKLIAPYDDVKDFVSGYISL